MPIDYGPEREEGKEEEYDYFLDPKTDENENENQGYHLIDENNPTGDQEDEDLEELDDEEKEERHLNMLADFKKKIDKEEKED